MMRQPDSADHMDTVRCVSPVVGTSSLVEPISLGSLVSGLPCFSLDTSRIFGSWFRRAVYTISSIFTTASHESICFRCYGRVWRSS